jgi:hypothetical protein
VSSDFDEIFRRLVRIVAGDCLGLLFPSLNIFKPVRTGVNNEGYFGLVGFGMRLLLHRDRSGMCLGGKHRMRRCRGTCLVLDPNGSGTGAKPNAQRAGVRFGLAGTCGGSVRSSKQPGCPNHPTSDASGYRPNQQLAGF